MTLHQCLSETYCNHAARSRGAANNLEFKLDDREERDVLHIFCSISVTLPNRSSNEFQLTLHNVPWDEDVEDFVEQLCGQWEEVPMGRILKLPMSIKSAPTIRKLAKAIRKVTGRGKTYDNSNWKWVTRRTAESLERFAAILAEVYRTQRQMRPSTSGG